MSNLIHIKELVDQALEDLAQGKQRMIKNTIIILHRLRPAWNNFFETFQSLLKNIETMETRCYFYERYMFYLQKHLNADPWESLVDYLSKKNYTQEEISSLTTTYNEGAFFNRLSKNTTFLFVSLFYLYQPNLTEKFLKNSLLHYLTAEEEELIKNYRKLSCNEQDDISFRVERMIESSNP